MGGSFNKTKKKRGRNAGILTWLGVYDEERETLIEVLYEARLVCDMKVIVMFVASKRRCNLEGLRKPNESMECSDWQLVTSEQRDHVATSWLRYLYVEGWDRH